MNDIQLYHPYGFIISPWYSYLRSLLYSLSLVIILGCLVFACYMLRAWYVKRSIKPWHRAFSAINMLEDLTDQKEFYFGISRIIKHYCTERFKGCYESLSDQEIIEALLINKACSEDLCLQLKTIFNSMHAIKFYTHQEQVDYRSTILEQTHFFIKSTIPS